MAELPRVATNFFTLCNKCQQDRYHKVLAHVTSTAAKIECEVCHSKKNYTKKSQSISKGLNVAKKAARTRKPKSAEAIADAANEKFRGLLEKAGDSKAEPYRMNSTYAIDMKIEHPKFGVGVVTAAWMDKIEVTFEDASRQLVQNRK